jgi:ATP adenylyltransferase
MSLKPKILRESFREGTGLTLIAAPWRHKYFEQPPDPECFICRALAAEPSEDAKNLLLVRGQRAVIILNRYPYTMGALIIAPVAHVADLRLVDDESALEMTQLVKYGMNILEAAIHPPSFNVGINQGEHSGAGLKDHLHMHLVPRWGGDTNFMTAIAEARVLAEDTDSMYERLYKTIETLESNR